MKNLKNKPPILLLQVAYLAKEKSIVEYV
jgi:hypothetical protein